MVCGDNPCNYTSLLKLKNNFYWNINIDKKFGNLFNYNIGDKISLKFV